MKKFTEYLDDFSFDDLIALWNEYASENAYDSTIFDSVEDFADLTDTQGAELARMVFFGNVQNWGGMVYLNGYGNFQSCWNVENSPIDLDVLAEWLGEENHDVYKEWKDAQPTFEEWLEDTYNKDELSALWAEYMKEGVEFNIVYLADTIADNEGDEYLDYKKEVFE